MPGREVYAIIKAVSLDRDALSRTPLPAEMINADATHFFASGPIIGESRSLCGLVISINKIAVGCDFDRDQCDRPANRDNWQMPLFIYRCPSTGARVQGFSPEDVSEDSHSYEPVTCPVCHQIHHVNPTTGKVLGGAAKERAGP